MKLKKTFCCVILCQEHTRGEDIFNAIDCYFNEKDINLSNCCGLCTDGASLRQVFPPVFTVGSPQGNRESLLHPQAKPSI